MPAAWGKKKNKKNNSTGLLRSGGALAVLSSSSLSEPPEELLSEAAGGTLLFAFVAVSVAENPAFTETVPDRRSCGYVQTGHSPIGLWFWLACWVVALLPRSTGELHLGPLSALEGGGDTSNMVWNSLLGCCTGLQIMED